MGKSTALSGEIAQWLLQILEQRFEKNEQRHPGVAWSTVAERLKRHPNKLWSLHQMEISGGEPDVIGMEKHGAIVFADCSAESPKDRRSCCYDQKALDARKENKPKHNAVSMAEAMGVALLNEQEYRQLQTLGAFDLKTSSWVDTPASIRKLGGALFCDRRYDTVFVYHNGAESYYAARGWRGKLEV